jgi:transcriptional regulator with PAS, ATPase and Fis domain
MISLLLRTRILTMHEDWIKEFKGAITVCDEKGVIIEMNEKAKQEFFQFGGEKLLGQNLLDCHNPTSQQILKDLLAHPKMNVYTIEKKGIKKIIYQAPRFIDGKHQGIVELSLELPPTVPHKIRD